MAGAVGPDAVGEAAVERLAHASGCERGGDPDAAGGGSLMRAKTLTARRLVTGIGVIEYPVVRVDDEGRIAEVFSRHFD